jgi:hypothetical protein
VAPVRTSRDFPATVAEAEALWYDLERWPSFVEGFHHVEKVDGGWPEAGGVLVWRSTPAGRGRVQEAVTEHLPGQGQTVDVDDDQLLGTRRVRFAPRTDGVRIELSLSYQLKDRSPLKRLADVFFIRRALRDSLRRELSRFGYELQSDRSL